MATEGEFHILGRSSSSGHIALSASISSSASDSSIAMASWNIWPQLVGARRTQAQDPTP